MTTPTDRAAEALWASVDDKGIRGRLFREDCDYLAQVLHDHGLLTDAAPTPAGDCGQDGHNLFYGTCTRCGHIHVEPDTW